MDDFLNRLPVKPGVTAILGSGGKTTLAEKLAQFLPGTVIFTTTTRIFPWKNGAVFVGNDEIELGKLLEVHKKVCVGQVAEQGKLQESSISMSRLASLADYVLVETDGSKNLPIKAHRDFEPVVPAETNLRILVVGASGLGQKVEAICHCPELFAQKAGCDIGDFVSAENLARVIQGENLADLVLVNQCETEERQAEVARLATRLKVPVFYGSLQLNYLNTAENNDILEEL